MQICFSLHLCQSYLALYQTEPLQEHRHRLEKPSMFPYASQMTQCFQPTLITPGPETGAAARARY